MIKNAAILDAVEAALSLTHPRAPRDVHKAMGPDCEIARVTVRHALAILVKYGRATSAGEDGKRQYRRVDQHRLAETRRVHALAARAEET